MSDDDDESCYKVGYKRPPKEHQFKKGSKKPAGSGRQKGYKSSYTIIDELLNETVTVSPDGRTMTKKELFIRRNFEKAMNSPHVKDSVSFVDLTIRLAPKAIDPPPPILFQMIPGDESL